jgi:hypothetical protein
VTEEGMTLLAFPLHRNKYHHHFLQPANFFDVAFIIVGLAAWTGSSC